MHQIIWIINSEVDAAMEPYSYEYDGGREYICSLKEAAKRRRKDIILYNREYLLCMNVLTDKEIGEIICDEEDAIIDMDSIMTSYNANGMFDCWSEVESNSRFALHLKTGTIVTSSRVGEIDINKTETADSYIIDGSYNQFDDKKTKKKIFEMFDKDDTITVVNAHS